MHENHHKIIKYEHFYSNLNTKVITFFITFHFLIKKNLNYSTTQMQ